MVGGSIYLLVVIGCSGHFELDVLQTRGLRNLPVDAGNVVFGRAISHVNDKVANLAVKVVLLSPR